MSDPDFRDPLDPQEPPVPTPAAAPPADKRAAAAAAIGEVGWERATIEKLAFAALAEQRAALRWKTFTRLAWLAFLVIGAWLLFHRAQSTASTTTSSQHSRLPVSNAALEKMV